MTTTTTRHEDGSVTRVGGVVRVTHGDTSHEEPAAHSEVPLTGRVGGSITRFNGSTGQAETSSGSARYQHTNERPNPTGSVLQSMRQDGRATTVELIPGQPASRTLLSVALSEGLLIETAPGIYADRNTGQAQQGPGEAPQADDKAANADPLADTIYNRAELDMWESELDHVPQHSYDSAVAGVTAALSSANPESLEGVVAELAQSAGLDLGEAQEIVDTGIEWFARSISKDLQKSLGMSPQQVDSFYDSLRERGHPQLARAIQELSITGRPETFRELALGFKVKAAESTDMSLFRKAGYDTRVDQATGDVVVRRGQGPWMTLAQMAKG